MSVLRDQIVLARLLCNLKPERWNSCQRCTNTHTFLNYDTGLDIFSAISLGSLLIEKQYSCFLKAVMQNKAKII